MAEAARRFWAKVDMSGACWLWTGAKKPTGYGNFWAKPQYWQAHRWAYVAAYGPIPDGLVLDHLCRRPSCVRPSHLEAVTHGDNTLRGDNCISRNAQKLYCSHGHLYTPENTVYERAGRRCRECRARQNRRTNERRKMERGRLNGG